MLPIWKYQRPCLHFKQLQFRTNSLHNSAFFAVFTFSLETIFQSNQKFESVSDYYLLTGCKGPYREIINPRLEVRTELARSVRKKRGFSISRYGTSNPVSK